MLPIRDDHVPTRAPFATTLLLVACLAVFLRELGLAPDAQDAFVSGLALYPDRQAEACRAFVAELPFVPAGVLLDLVLPFLTSLFVHAGVLHLAGNLWFLWVFGRTVEDLLGALPFTCLYLGCGFVAGIVHVFAVSGQETLVASPLGVYWASLGAQPTIGASGAIAGVLGAYLMLTPRSRMLTFVPPLFLFVLPGLLFLALWFALQLLGAHNAGETGSHIAYAAHLGGFVAGMVFAVGAMVVRPERLAR